MVMQTSGLGKGLGALIPKKTIAEFSKEIGEQVFEIPVEKIRPNPRQPRREFTAASLEELTHSIRAHGILQPIVVMKTPEGYELIVGERRLRAAKKVGLMSVPAVVRTASDTEKLELSLIENLQREDLNPIEEARAYRALIDEFMLTHDEIARRVGKSRPVISNALRLLDLPAEMQEALINGKMTYSAARALLSVPTDTERWTLFRRLMQGEKIGSAEIEKKAPPQRRAEDPNLKAAEAELREALATKVTVGRRGSRGTIVIEFYSDEELRAILNRITG